MRVLQRQHFGFTLIELLITVAIAAIVVGGSIAGFVRFNERQEVQNTAKEVQQLMRTAQSKARVRDAPDAAVDGPCFKLTSYQVERTANAFTLKPNCELESGAASLGTEVGNVAIPTGMTVNPAAGLTTDFTTLENGVVFSDGSTSKVFSFAKNGYTYSFTVSANGNISNVE